MYLKIDVYFFSKQLRAAMNCNLYKYLVNISTLLTMHKLGCLLSICRHLTIF